MKKVLIVALAFLLLIVSLVGCTNRNLYESPEINQTFSDEFLDTFLDNYSVRDPNLYYYTAEEYGGLIARSEIEQKLNIEHSLFDDLLLAKIDDADMDQFMLGTRYIEKLNLNLLGHGEEAHCYVYSHKDAPDPIKDWTVKSIELYTVSERASDHYFSDTDNDYQQGFGTYLKNEGKIIHSWENNEDNQAFISDVLSAIKSESNNTFDYFPFQDCISPNSPVHKYTYIVISFKECSGIVWAADLIVDLNSFQIAHYIDDNGQTLTQRQKGVLKSLSADSNSLLDSFFNTLVTVDTNPSILPNYSDFEGITENMTYEAVVSMVGFPHSIVYDYYGYGIEARYDTVEGKVYQISFERYNDGKLIVYKTRSYVPESNTN